MTTPVHADRRPLLRSLILGAAAVAAVALVGWLLLLFVKGTVVLISWVLGIALIVLPLLVARRVLAGHTGAGRWGRIRTIAEVVLLGAVLCVLAFFVGDHGWLLIAIPAAVVAALRVMHAVTARRARAIP